MSLIVFGTTVMADSVDGAPNWRGAATNCAAAGFGNSGRSCGGRPDCAGIVA